MNLNIKFINHACFSIEKNNELIIVDPWFFGRVFNNSWSLFKETEKIDLRNLKYIFITHEHPDHLHWPTLKYIKENTEQEIKVVFGLRKNKNVIDNVRKLGFKCAEIPPNIEYKINDFLKVTNYPTNYDSAYVFIADDKVILNQNDCQLSLNQCREIKSKYPNIDVWWMQFSLAGYYANYDDVEGLNNAREYHKNLLRQYAVIFEPKIFIPFASFVYFCKEHNAFLNDWALNIEEIYKSFDYLPLQVLFYNDDLLLENFAERNKINLQKWMKIYKIKKTIIEYKLVTDIDILNQAEKMLRSIKNINKNVLPAELIFEFYDKENFFKINCREGTCSFIDKEKVEKEKIAAVLPSDELYSFFKFPWGADTLNITSCFEIKNENLWRKMLTFKDTLYER